MVKVLIRYAEIGLKGGNRRFFEDQLIKNIKISLNNPKLQIIKAQKQFFISAEKLNLDKLKTVFGIAWYAPVIASDNKPELITKAALKLVEKDKTFAVRAHHDLEVSLGDIIRKEKKITVDLSNPQQTIYITQFNQQVLIFNQKLPGPGGLPVGTSGRVLCLLSGGFDSIAAAYLLAKRGAKIDFLHFHVSPKSGQVLKSKIKTIINKLFPWTLSHNLYLASYTPFQMEVLDLPQDLVNQELVVFRRLMVKVGEQLALKNHYQALILGDSLGQVASQTMENIVAVDQAVNIPIFRPLIGMDKKDIINLVAQIGLEETTNLPYKDCCSIVATHPSTKANLDKIAKIEKQIKIETIVKKIIQDVPFITL